MSRPVCIPARAHTPAPQTLGRPFSFHRSPGVGVKAASVTACELASQSVQALASSPGGGGACEHDLGTYRAHVSTWNRAVEVDE